MIAIAILIVLVLLSVNMSLVSNADEIVFCGSDYCVLNNGTIIQCGYLSNGITYCGFEPE